MRFVERFSSIVTKIISEVPVLDQHYPLAVDLKDHNLSTKISHN